MQETIAKESPRPRIGRRLGAAGMALDAALGLGACKATGGGYVAAPFKREAPVIGHYSKVDANFGFNFTCEVDMAKKEDRDQGRDHVPRHRTSNVRRS